MNSRKMPKGVIYAARINASDWESTHNISLRSPHSDDPGYYESSSIKLFGELQHPQKMKRQKIEVNFWEDLIGFNSPEKAPPSSVGEIELNKDTGLLSFNFFISTISFNRVSFSLVSEKINCFEARGDRIKHNYGNVFEYRIRTL